jgi:hypothetical protein
MGRYKFCQIPAYIYTGCHDQKASRNPKYNDSSSLSIHFFFHRLAISTLYRSSNDKLQCIAYSLLALLIPVCELTDASRKLQIKWE